MRFGTIHIEKRHNVPRMYKLINPVIFVLLALLFCSVLILAVGFSPIAVYKKMITYSFLNLRGISGSIKAGLPLMFCGLSVAIAFRMNIRNIGAEGQYAMGAILGGGFAIFAADMPIALRLIIMFILCAVGGAVWAMIAAFLKAYWNVNETIITLMLNYIALLFMDYLCYGPWMAANQTSPITETIPKEMYLPNIASAGISSGLFMALAVAILLSFFVRQTSSGYQMSVIKYSLGSAEYAGIEVKRFIIAVLALSGAIAGLAGFVQITGVVHRVQAQLPGGAGYTGIVIAYLSQSNPIVVIIVAILMGGLVNSSAALQIMGVPSQITTMLQGAIMIFVIAGEFFNNYKITFNRKTRKETLSDVKGVSR
jgi:ABC-type uncharacterized transport system permease subunit